MCYTFSSNIKPNCAFYRQNRKIGFFLGSFVEFKLRTVAIYLKTELPWNLRLRCNDFSDKLFLEHFRYSVFQENYYRKSMRADTEMKQILKSKLSIV